MTEPNRFRDFAEEEAAAVRTQSTIKPAWYWLRDLKNTTATVRVRWALKEIEPLIDELGGSESAPVRMWEYEEAELKLTVPKPKLDATALSVKTKQERYALADAIVVFARADDGTRQAFEDRKTQIMAELGIKAAEIIKEEEKTKK